MTNTNLNGSRLRRPAAFLSILTTCAMLALSSCVFYPGAGVIYADTTPEDIRRIDVSKADVGKILARGGWDVLFDARTGIERVPEGGLSLQGSPGVWVRRDEKGKFVVEVADDDGKPKRSWPPAPHQVDFIAGTQAESYREGASTHAEVCPVVLRAGRFVMFLSYGAEGWQIRKDEIDLAQVIGVHDPKGYALFFDIDRERHTGGFALHMLPWRDNAPAAGRDGFLLGGVAIPIGMGGGRGLGPRTRTSWNLQFEIVAMRFKVP